NVLLLKMLKLGKGFRPREPRSMCHARPAMQSQTGFANLLPAPRLCERVFHTVTWRTGSHVSHTEARWRAKPVTGQDKVASLCKPPLKYPARRTPFPSGTARTYLARAATAKSRSLLSRTRPRRGTDAERGSRLFT